METLSGQAEGHPPASPTLAYGLTTAVNQALLVEGYTPGADYQLFVSSSSGVMLALPVDAAERRDLVGGLLSALARAGITAPADAEETLLGHESVPLTADPQ